MGNIKFKGDEGIEKELPIEITIDLNKEIDQHFTLL